MNETRWRLLMQSHRQQAGDLEVWSQSLDDIRDAVLHGRHQLAEMDVDSDITNAVLGIIDDHDPRAAKEQ